MHFRSQLMINIYLAYIYYKIASNEGICVEV